MNPNFHFEKSIAAASNAQPFFDFRDLFALSNDKSMETYFSSINMNDEKIIHNLFNCVQVTTLNEKNITNQRVTVFLYGKNP